MLLELSMTNTNRSPLAFVPKNIAAAWPPAPRPPPPPPRCLPLPVPSVPVAGQHHRALRRRCRAAPCPDRLRVPSPSPRRRSTLRPPLTRSRLASHRRRPGRPSRSSRSSTSGSSIVVSSSSPGLPRSKLVSNCFRRLLAEIDKRGRERLFAVDDRGHGYRHDQQHDRAMQQKAGHNGRRSHVEIRADVRDCQRASGAARRSIGVGNPVSTGSDSNGVGCRFCDRLWPECRRLDRSKVAEFHRVGNDRRSINLHQRRQWNAARATRSSSLVADRLAQSHSRMPDSSATSSRVRSLRTRHVSISS